MKKIILFLFSLFAILRANCQQIEATSYCLASDVAATSFSITASGLVPASGTITVSAPVKFMVSSDGSTWDYTLTIPYSGGALSSTPLYAMYAGPSGLSNYGFVIISGGGVAGRNVTVCANVPSCPCATAGTDNIQPVVSSSISPNPTFNTLTVSSPVMLTSVIVSDLLGRTVATHPGNKDQTETIDVSGLSPGMYILRVNGSEVKRFVKE